MAGAPRAGAAEVPAAITSPICPADTSPAATPAMDATALLLQKVLLYGVLPLWMLAGFGDWLCHRVEHIEHTAGTKESALHWAMLAEL
jgi:hypothetical protein